MIFKNLKPQSSLKVGEIHTIRSSHRSCSVKKDVLTIYHTYLPNDNYNLSLHIELYLRSVTLLQKRLQDRFFLVNFAEYLRTPFLQNTSRRLLLHYSNIYPGSTCPSNQFSCSLSLLCSILWRTQVYHSNMYMLCHIKGVFVDPSHLVATTTCHIINNYISFGRTSVSIAAMLPVIVNIF